MLPKLHDSVRLAPCRPTHFRRQQSQTVQPGQQAVAMAPQRPSSSGAVPASSQPVNSRSRHPRQPSEADRASRDRIRPCRTLRMDTAARSARQQLLRIQFKAIRSCGGALRRLSKISRMRCGAFCMQAKQARSLLACTPASCTLQMSWATSEKRTPGDSWY
jgi:hypothetical protein